MNSQNNLTKHEKISHMCTEKLHMLFTPGGGGGRLGSNYARMCVSKSEGHGSFFGFKGVK